MSMFDDDPRPQGSGAVLWAFLGFAAGVAFSVAAFSVWRLVGEKPRPPVTLPPATQVAAVPSPLPTLPPSPIPIATPSAEPAPSPEPSGTRVARVAPPARPKPVTPATPAPPPIGPRVAALMSQAEQAVGLGEYEAAANFFEQVLELDPQNTRARVGHTGALTIAASLRRYFMPGVATAENVKTAPGKISGFDSGDVEVKRAPEVPGRIEFDVIPPHVKPGDHYNIRIYLLNTGKKGIKVKTMNVSRVANGVRTTTTVASRAGEIAKGERGLVETLPGVWTEDAASWSLEVSVVSQKGDTYQNRLTWK
jgi:hypothetical protein